MDAKEIVELRRWSLRLTMTGSDDVVLAWNKARKVAAYGPDTSEHPLKMWGELWLAMRKDCGHHDTSLKRSDMLASMINDIEEHREALDK